MITVTRLILEEQQSIPPTHNKADLVPMLIVCAFVCLYMQATNTDSYCAVSSAESSSYADRLRRSCLSECRQS